MRFIALQIFIAKAPKKVTDRPGYDNRFFVSLLIIFIFRNGFFIVFIKMAERGFQVFDEEHQRQAPRNDPGYQWYPDRFGPPPGIPRARKLELGQ